MSLLRIRYQTPIPASYRAARVAAALDDGKLESLTREIVCESPPTLAEPWRVGLIVGPSGSGKTSVARALYGEAAIDPDVWNPGGPVVDDFAEHDFDRLQSALAAVGFGAPVRQLQPFATLSVGEQFRCALARRLLESRTDVVVADEFANPLDRTVAAAASIAARKALDRGVFQRRRLVAVTTRDDVEAWLEPDWTLDMRSGKIRRGRLRRPKLRFAIRTVGYDVWREFKDFHYLSGGLNRAAARYAAFVDGVAAHEDDVNDGGGRSERGANWLSSGAAVAFAATLPCEGRPGRRRVHRLVVRPELQGLGLGGAFLDELGRMEASEGRNLEIVTGSPFFVRRLVRSPLWRLRNVYPHGRTQRSHGKTIPGSFGRAIASFEFTERGGGHDWPAVCGSVDNVGGYDGGENVVAPQTPRTSGPPGTSATPGESPDGVGGRFYQY